MYQKPLLSGVVLTCCIATSGCFIPNSYKYSIICNTFTTATQKTTPSKTSTTIKTVTPSVSTITWVPEPGSGATPWVNSIDSAKSKVYLNEYLITDTPILDALISAANRGLDVKVIADAHPYGDASAVTKERAGFAALVPNYPSLLFAAH